MPELTADRLIERIAEAMQIAMEPAKLGDFPPWTQRVMRILKEQLVPREFVSILSAGESVFAEGVAVAWVAKGRDLLQTPAAKDGEFARQLVDRLSTAADFVRGKIPGIIPGSVSVVDARDGAQTSWTVLTRGRRGERYLSAGRRLTFADHAPLLERVTGSRPRAEISLWPCCI